MSWSTLINGSMTAMLRDFAVVVVVVPSSNNTSHDDYEKSNSHGFLSVWCSLLGNPSGHWSSAIIY